MERDLARQLIELQKRFEVSELEIQNLSELVQNQGLEMRNQGLEIERLTNTHEHLEVRLTASEDTANDEGQS